MCRLSVFVVMLLELFQIFVQQAILSEEVTTCRLYPSRSEPTKQYFWCQSTDPMDPMSVYGSPISFGQVLHENGAWKIRTEEEGTIEAIIPGAFKDLVNISSIHLDFPLRVIRSGDFSDTPNITLLEITVSQLDRCAFVGVASSLERLILHGKNGTLSVHQDSLIGLSKLFDLTLGEFQHITYVKVEKNEETICQDFLCALHSLKELHYGRDPNNEACDPMLFTLPKSFDIDHEYDNRTGITCDVVRHTCDYTQNPFCGNATYLQTCPNISKPSSSLSWHWIPWVLAAFMLLLLLILLIIVIYWLRGDAKYDPVPANSPTSVATAGSSSVA